MTALADYDFRTVFRQIRGHTGWSQQVLGDLGGLDQPQVSMIERGVRRLRDVGLVAQLATGLCIPPALLGFGGSGAIVKSARGDAQKLVSWVDRRDFIERVAGLALGATGLAALDINRLIALLPHADPTGTRHVGVPDVAVIEQATAAFIRDDYATGAGPVRELAVAHLGSVLPLLNATMTEETRPRLHLAIASLATTAGWMSFEVKQHDAARRLWMIGLDVVRAANHPQGSDLTVFLLHDMALQAVHLGRPVEALRLAHLGHAATAGPHRVSAATTCTLMNVQALAHAAQNDAAQCDRVLGQAAEHFSSVNPGTLPAWNYLDDTRLASLQGGAHYELALASQNPRAAGRAVPLLRHAVDHFSSGYARLQANALVKLAGAHALAGDTDTAVSAGHQAIDAVTALHSPRAYDLLRVLNTTLEPLHTSPGVTELRDRLMRTTA